jgi:hypothetical protein
MTSGLAGEAGERTDHVDPPLSEYSTLVDASLYVNAILNCPSPGITSVMSGAELGIGVTPIDGSDALPVPRAFVALTV